MSRTTKELSEKVLRKLGRLPAHQTMTASQEKHVTDEYDDLYQELLDNSIVNWASSDDIPSNVYNPIYNILRERLKADFGVPGMGTSELELYERRMRLKISKVITNPYISQTTQFEDF